MISMHDRPSRELARQWDGRDPLARFRKQFSRPAGQIYLQGGSLGLCSQEAERALLRALADWKSKAHEGTPGWAATGEDLGRRVAGLLGATPEEVALTSSSALGLQHLLATLYRRQFHRPRILLDAFCPPALRGMLHGHLLLRGVEAARELRIFQPNESWLLDEGALEAALADPMLQLVFLPTVVRATGQRLDVAGLARAARSAGVLFGLDLSGSLGVLPHALDEWEVDFAIWDHRHFVNGGPGAAAGIYLNRRHLGQPEEVSWSDDAAVPNESAASGAAAALHLEPAPLFGLAPLEGSLRLLEEAGVERLRAKSLDLTQFLRCTIESEIPTLDLLTPREPETRGGHLALFHPAAAEICGSLRALGVSADLVRAER